ncbi:hypothetical protein D7V90_07695 [bacterium 1xD42-87]|nr:hypothetical protein D7V90_07695 [bacterium 1xD42-87]
MEANRKPLENNLVAFIVEKIRKEGQNRMDKNTYTLGKKFECCGKTMVTVIIKGRAACVMTELEYNRIIETERKYLRNNRLRRSA